MTLVSSDQSTGAGRKTSRYGRRGGLLAGMAIFLPGAILIASHAGAVGAQELAHLRGVWRGTELTLLGPTAAEVIFFPNGTYSRSHVLGSLMTRDSGRYEVVRNWVHFYLEDWGPTEYLGQPLTWPTSDTWVVTRFDGRVLETANIHLMRVQ